MPKPANPERAAARERLADDLSLLRALNETRRAVDLSHSERDELEEMRAAALLRIHASLIALHAARRRT